MKIFVHNEIYRQRCYLFNISFFYSSMFYLHVYVQSCMFSARGCVWKCTVFCWILNTGPHSSVCGWGEIQLWGPGRGASVRPRGRGLSEASGEGPLRGAPGGRGSDSLAPALSLLILTFAKLRCWPFPYCNGQQNIQGEPKTRPVSIHFPEYL